jgi:hypothetical protein
MICGSGSVPVTPVVGAGVDCARSLIVGAASKVMLRASVNLRVKCLIMGSLLFRANMRWCGDYLSKLQNPTNLLSLLRRRNSEPFCVLYLISPDDQKKALT